MRIAVFGVGGVDGYFGGRLAQAGEEVVFIARGPHLQALQTNGLRVESVSGDFVVQPVQATDDPTHVGIVDAVLVAVKAWQVPEVAAAIRPLIGAMWMKLLFMTSFSGLGALTRVPVGSWRSVPETRRMSEAVARPIPPSAGVLSGGRAALSIVRIGP